VGVVGVGDVAQRDYLPEFARLAERATLEGVMSRDAERASTAARRFGASRWTTSVEELLSWPEIDIVLNLTPAQVHEEVSLAAIHAGKHLYTEKPAAPTAQGIRNLLKAASARRVSVAAAPSVLVFPQVRLACNLLARGDIGRVTSVTAIALGGVPPWEGYISDPTPFFQQGGGPLRDMGVYPLHAITGMLGPVANVLARSSRTIADFRISSGPHAGLDVPVEVDDDWHLLLELTSGVVAEVHPSFAVSNSLSPEMELQGRHGALGLSLLDVSRPIQQLREDGEVKELAVPHERVDGGPDHLLGVAHLIDHVLDGQPLMLDLDHAAHVLDVIEAAESSARTGRSVSISSPDTNNP
jgi:predicted dehydrogenase